jgi:hypothetical protein
MGMNIVNWSTSLPHVLMRVWGLYYFAFIFDKKTFVKIKYYNIFKEFYA